MEFFLTLGLLALIAGLLSGAITVPIFRVKKQYAKPLAVVIGVCLFVFFCWAEFVILVIVSAQRGHPF